MDTGIKTLEEFNRKQAAYNEYKAAENAKLDQLPIANTVGEFALPVGALKALKIGGKSTKLATNVGAKAKTASTTRKVGK